MAEPVRFRQIRTPRTTRQRRLWHGLPRHRHLLGPPGGPQDSPPQMAADADFVERFRKEARMAAQLENPHVVTIYEVGEEDGPLLHRHALLPRREPGRPAQRPAPCPGTNA